MVEARSDLYQINPRSVKWNGIGFQAALKGGGDDIYVYMGEVDQPIQDYTRWLFTRDLAKADEASTIIAIVKSGHCGLGELIEYRDLAQETTNWLQGRRGEGFNPLVFGVAVNIQLNGKIGYSPRQIGLWQKLGY